MDFKDQVKQLGDRVAKLKDQIQTEEAHYGLYFAYDQELIRLAKQVGCVFSWKKTCWYVPRTKDNLHKLFSVFKALWASL